MKLKRAEMRITAMNEDNSWIWIQRKIKGEWQQFGLNEMEFILMMALEFMDYWEIYLETDTEESAIDFFYHYGETEEMKRKGEAFIYK